MRKEHLFTQNFKEDNKPYTFYDMIRDMIPDIEVNPNDKMIKGCQILMPETLLIKDGRFDFLTHWDKEFCLSFDTKTKLTSIKVRVKLLEATKDRRLDCVQHGVHNRVDKREL